MIVASPTGVLGLISEQQKAGIHMPSAISLIPLGTLHLQTGPVVTAGFLDAVAAVTALALPPRAGSDLGRAAR